MKQYKCINFKRENWQSTISGTGIGTTVLHVVAEYFKIFHQINHQLEC